MARIFPILEPLGVKFIATVHDEFVFECNKTQTDFVMETVKREMEMAGAQYFTDIPCKVEVFSGDYWHK